MGDPATRLARGGPPEIPGARRGSPLSRRDRRTRRRAGNRPIREDHGNVKRHDLIRELTAITGPEGVISEPEQLLTYESDGLRNYRTTPMLVVLPGSTQ